MRNWINIALPKGRLGEKAYDIFEAIGYGCPSIHEGGRKLIFENEENGVRYFWVKPSDVAAGVKGERPDGGHTLRVATKFPNIAREFYRKQSREIDIIELHGSIEIAPILKMSDVIVDIVETGTTLRENNLEVIETVVPISARLIANKVSYKFNNARIRELCDRIAENLEKKD